MARWIQAVLMVTVSALCLVYSCPMPGCNCGRNDNGDPIIYCKYKGFTRIPRVEPSSEVYAQLTLSNNYITEIPAQAFQGLIVKSIEIKENPIANISNQAFSGVETTLEGLSLHADGRLDAPWRAVANLTMLKQLEFSDFTIGTLEDDTALVPFVYLEKLALTKSQLNYIKPSVLQPLNRTLKELDLKQNGFQSLPGAIRGLVMLTKLTMSSNQIERIGYNVFETNVLLSELDLSQNPIAELEQGCFNYVTGSLHYLGLHLNRIPGDQLTAIRDLTAIQQLNLGYNSLESIPPGTFSNMADLEFLNIQAAQLETLSPAIFQGLGSSMVGLTLTDNRISRIDPGTFSAMTNLRDLSLDDQKNYTFAQTLVPGVFQGLENLESLHLPKTKNFGSPDNWNAITELQGLTKLYLSESGISQVPGFTFSNMRRLQVLDLSKNKLKNISQETFVGLRDSLTFLDLHGNNLTVFDHCTFADFSRLYPETVKLDENELQCNCDLQWLSEWVQKRLNGTSPINRNIIRQQILWTCSDGRKFVDVHPEDLICPENTTRRECGDYYTTTTTIATTPETTTTSTPAPTTTPTTTPKPTTTTEPSVVLLFNITDVTTTGFDMKWTVSHPSEVEYFMVFYTDLSTSEQQNSRRISSASTTFSLEKLKPGNLYEICVTVFYKRLSIGSSRNCTTRETAPIPTTAPSQEQKMSGEQIGIIVGSAIGGVLLIVIIIIIIFILVRHRQQEHVYAKPQEPSPWQRAGKPHEAYDSKRFTKQKKPGNEHHIKEIKHVPADTNLQRTSAGSYQYLDSGVGTPVVNGNPIGLDSSGFQHRAYNPQTRPHVTDCSQKYYEIAETGIESHI